MLKIVIPFAFLFSFAILLTFESCKKKDKEEPTPSPITDICNGDPSDNSYFPLKVGNSWTHSQGSFDLVSSIMKDTIVNQKSYFVSSGGAYLRQDSNGDILSLSKDSLAIGKISEFLVVPGNPLLGQTWVDEEKTTYEVISFNSSFTTPNCVYSNLVLKINLTYEGTTGPCVAFYYKKGIGWLGSEFINTTICTGTPFVLSKINLN